MADSNRISKRKNPVYEITSVVFIVIFAILFLFPLYWIITGSFKTAQQVNSVTPVWFPTEWVMTNYQNLFSRQTAPRWEFIIPFT